MLGNEFGTVPDSFLLISKKFSIMPLSISSDSFDNAEKVDNSIVMPPCDFDSLSQKERSLAQKMFSMIASVIFVVDDEKRRNDKQGPFCIKKSSRTKILLL